jgi:hypothetical protein
MMTDLYIAVDVIGVVMFVLFGRWMNKQLGEIYSLDENEIDSINTSIDALGCISAAICILLRCN